MTEKQAPLLYKHHRPFQQQAQRHYITESRGDEIGWLVLYRTAEGYYRLDGRRL